MIPASRAEARGWRIVLWALFGNDDGGLYGEYDAWGTLPGNTEKTIWTQIRWWVRNPFHNLTWHVLTWKRDRALVLCEYPGPVWWRRRAPMNWIADGPHFQLTAAPLFMSWRYGGWEGYLGWRENGVLGVALRRSSKA